MITCPKCNREQYYTCGKESCVCNQRVPQGEKPQVYLGNDIIACPYCGFAEHIDFWAECEMQIVTQANNSVYTDAGDSAVSTSSLQASAESTSQTVTQPTQRG